MLYKQLSLCFTLLAIFCAVPVSAKFIKADVRYPALFENAFLENMQTERQHNMKQNILFMFDNRELYSNCTWNLIFVNNHFNFPDNHQTKTFLNSYHYLPGLSAVFQDNRSKYRICEKVSHHDFHYSDNLVPDNNCDEEHHSKVPEPGIVSLMLGGLLSAGGLYLRKRN